MTRPGGHEFDDVVRMPLVTSPPADAAQPMYQIRAAEGLALRPGDTLVVRFKDPIDDMEMSEFQARFAEYLPDNKVVAIVADGMVVATNELSDVVQRDERVRAKFAEWCGEWGDSAEPIPVADVREWLEG